MLHILQLHQFDIRHKHDKQYCTLLALLVIAPLALIGGLNSHVGVTFTIGTFIIVKLLLNTIDSIQLIIRITIGAIRHHEM